MFDHGLSGRLWPIHYKPYKDEVLSSWLVRLSRAYGTEPDRFCARVWSRGSFWSRDIDKGTDDELLLVLVAKTATRRTRVLATTLRGYRGYLEAELMMKRPPWLLNLGLRDDIRHRPWLQYCPHCLRADTDPYFRRSWRLAFVTVCTVHHRRLLDRCGACGAVINMHRLPGGVETMTLCHGCLRDMRWAQAPTLQQTMKYQRLVRFQTFLLNTMRTGRCWVSESSLIDGVRFFRVLHGLARRLLTAMRAPVFNEAFGQYIPSSLNEPRLSSSTPRAIEVLSVHDRLDLMLLVAWWVFEQWPERFMTLGAEAQLPR